MNNMALMAALLVIAAVAVLVTGSVWAGLIIAALELGLWGLTRYIKSPRHQSQR